jgi:hypothetical protein
LLAAVPADRAADVDDALARREIERWWVGEVVGEDRGSVEVRA